MDRYDKLIAQFDDMLGFAWSIDSSGEEYTKLLDKFETIIKDFNK